MILGGRTVHNLWPHLLAKFSNKSSKRTKWVECESDSSWYNFSSTLYFRTGLVKGYIIIGAGEGGKKTKTHIWKLKLFLQWTLHIRDSWNILGRCITLERHGKPKLHHAMGLPNTIMRSIKPLRLSKKNRRCMRWRRNIGEKKKCERVK